MKTSSNSSGSKKVSLKRYIIRIPFVLAILLFFLLAIMWKVSAVFLQSQARQQASQIMETFYKNNETLFIEGNFDQLARKVYRLLSYPPVIAVQLYDAGGSLVTNRRKRITGGSGLIFKLPHIQLEKAVTSKDDYKGKLHLTLNTHEESRVLQTLTLILLGVFSLVSGAFFLFVRSYHKEMNRELKLLEQSIQKEVEVESLQTQEFSIRELALIQSKMKSDSKDLRLLKEELQRKENLALIGNFASSIVHDIRNPLSVINGYAELMRDSSEGPHKQFTNKVIMSAEAIERLLEDILKFVREQKLELIMLENKSEQVVQSAIEFLEPLMEKMDIHIDRDHVTEFAIFCDLDRISRALMNLIKNSIQASGQGSAIYLKAYKEKEYAVFTVRDNGTGIPPSIRDTVFEPFARADKRKGTGLGLFIVKNIVEAHRGAVTFETGPAGTEFFVKLPL